MNILFMSLIDYNSFSEHNLYTDLLREFIKNGHTVYCVSPTEKRQNQTTHVISEKGGFILKQRIGNIQKCNIIEKGISTLLVERQFISGIKKHFKNVRLDFVLYSTPPITFAKVIRYIKKRDGAKTYLMLKDIFPQNSVDLGMLSTDGIKGLIYKHFRNKEKKLYSVSDRIGCMSEANRQYVLSHNPEISADKVEVCPNCIDVRDIRLTDAERFEMREKYDLPHDKRIFVYGGNLGKPQDVSFIVKCLKAVSDVSDAYFVIAGNGTDRHILEKYIETEQPKHVRLFEQIPKDEYDRMIACCDVGLIFLDHRFTIPNFPSRLLSYMQAGLPVLACTDSATDVGKTVTDGNFGLWCESNDPESFVKTVNEIKTERLDIFGNNAFEYLNANYSCYDAYLKITKRS